MTEADLESLIQEAKEEEVVEMTIKVYVHPDARLAVGEIMRSEAPATNDELRNFCQNMANADLRVAVSEWRMNRPKTS